MAITDELERLAAMHKSGVLNDKEYGAAKAKLLSHEEPTVGKAANSLVKFFVVAFVVVVLLVVGFFFFFFLPQWNKMDANMQSQREQFDKKWEQFGKGMPNGFSGERPGSLRLDQEK